jgi:hypothetical protein
MTRMHEEKALFDSLLQTAVILCSQSIESDENASGEVFVNEQRTSCPNGTSPISKGFASC